jgi:hypothetical protein
MSATLPPRSCRQLGVCQDLQPRCLDCRPPLQGSPTFMPMPGRTRFWTDHETTEDTDHPIHPGRLYTWARRAVLGVAAACAVIGAGVVSGYLWGRWL